MLTVYAPAKVNLVLEVLEKHDDYHQISSILQTIDLCDVLSFELAEQISVECSEPSLAGNNVVAEAAMLLKKATKYDKGAQIELHKHIPWGVGLGGGSSDAASALLALTKLWKRDLPVSELVRLASKLGSDVPFFIYGGTALIEGMGEKVTPLPPSQPTYFVLLVPPLAKIPAKTKRLYSKLNAGHFTKGELVHAALLLLRREKTIPPALMFNTFEKVAFDFFPRLTEYKRRFEEAGAAKVCLAGSGPCLFTPVREEEKAKNLYLRLKNQGLECYLSVPLTRAN
jgi:4-diphosphocytidyl-2-C-methyl-D-erythritol kinase